MSELCKTCPILKTRENKEPVKSDIKQDSTILILVDFPVIEDTEHGIILSGITHRRVRFIHSILKDAKIDDRKVSYASVLRCITRSKSMITQGDYELCSKHILSEIDGSDIKTVICFGSMPGYIMTGKRISSIDEVRGVLTESIIPGINVMITYSMQIAIDGTGCGSCNYSNLYPSLVLKDISTAAKDLRRRKLL